ALRADERHETDFIELFLLVAIGGNAQHATKALVVSFLVNGNEKASADGELLGKGGRNKRPAGRNDDGIERRMLRQSERAVAACNVDVTDSELCEPAPRGNHERLVALDRVHLAREMRK